MALPSAFGITPTFALIFLISSTFLPSGLANPIESFFAILFFIFLEPFFYFLCQTIHKRFFGYKKNSLFCKKFLFYAVSLNPYQPVLSDGYIAFCFVLY